MRTGVRLSWRLATVVAFGATAAVAVTLSRGAPTDAALASASTSAAGHTVAGHTVAGHTVAGHTVAGHTVAGHTVAGHKVAGQTVLGHAVTKVTPACAVSGLRISVGPGARVSAVLTRYPVEFTNVSRAPCTLAGYPQVTAYQGDGVEVGDSAAHDPSVAASRVLLVPGQTAHASLDAAVTLPRCRPVRAAGLRVVVGPGQPAVRYVRPMMACTVRAAKGQDYLRVRAIQAGTGAA